MDLLNERVNYKRKLKYYLFRKDKCDDCIYSMGEYLEGLMYFNNLLTKQYRSYLMEVEKSKNQEMGG
ncbi:hypothetical protein QMK38_10565 [Lysinibacillus fusiformis]|nr:hypothetical protein [Lysinibacillus fusiformis]